MSQRKPNAIGIMVDQQKASSSLLWGNTFCETPALAARADDGVLFDCAVTPNPHRRRSTGADAYPNQGRHLLCLRTERAVNS